MNNTSSDFAVVVRRADREESGRRPRDAVYKTMFDARRKLRGHLVTHGHLDPGTEAR